MGVLITVRSVRFFHAVKKVQINMVITDQVVHTLNKLMEIHGSFTLYLPSWELTHPLPKVLLKMIFLFPRWGYVSSLEGTARCKFVFPVN